MAYRSGNRMPDNSILRRGTLITGVPRQEPQPDSDPMQGAVDGIEKALEQMEQKKVQPAPDWDDPNREETVEGAIRAEAQRRLQVRRMVEKAVSKK